MVRTYWLVQVFNEASWNLDLQPNRTDDQVESNSAPRYVKASLAPEDRYRFLCLFLTHLPGFRCFPFLHFLDVEPAVAGSVPPAGQLAVT